MWKKTLLAAAVAGFALPAKPAETEAQDSVPPAAKTPPSNPQEEPATQLDAVRVEGARPEGLKADDQSSASKIPLSLRETPQSVSVITRESLDERQALNLMQALELSAGVTQYSGNGPFAGQPSFGFNQTTIRGVQISDLYDFREDGFVNGSYFSIPDLAIYDRIEVVKGPSSIMYGRGSAGGLVNRIRKKPLAQAQTQIELSAGSFDTYRADLDVSRPELGSRHVRGRVVAAYEDSGSFVRGPETQRTVLAPSLDLDLTDTTRLLLMGLYQNEDIVPNTGTSLAQRGDGFVAPKISRRRYNGVVTDDPYSWKVLSATAQLDQELGDRWLGSLRLNTSNIKTPIVTEAYVYSFRDDGDDPATPDVVERRGDTFILGNDFAIDRDIWSGELQLSGRFDLAGREVKAAFGADQTRNQYSRRGAYTEYVGANLYDEDSFVLPDRSTLVPGFAFGDDPISRGIYAQAQMRPLDRLSVLLGARYDHVKLRSTPGHSAADPAPPDEKEVVKDFTARIGLTYDLSREVSVYTLYSQSFEPTSSTGQDGKLLDPETGEIYELGAKTEWFGGRLGISAALYRIDRENIPVDALVAPNETPYSVSSGLQRSDGFEIEINGRPLPGWDLSLAFNQVDSAYEDERDPLFGTNPGGAADWQLGAYSAYELQDGPLKGLGFGATVFAIDDRGIGFARGTIPGYERLDLHASYRAIRNVEINLVVRNVTDEIYIEGADRRSAYAQFGSPTAALLSIKYSM
jgi:TonB-dependent siderophore receptor